MSPEQSARRPGPAQIPSDMKAFNQKVIEEFRANGGRLTGPLAGSELVLLTTTGAKSGQPRTLVLGYRNDGERYVAIASGNGAPRHPAWYLNLLANPKATLEVGADKIQVRARTARQEERERLATVIPYFEGEQKKTSREIPFVVFERT